VDTVIMLPADPPPADPPGKCDSSLTSCGDRSCATVALSYCAAFYLDNNSTCRTQKPNCQLQFLFYYSCRALQHTL
jgi:hypothetical protein